VLSDYIDFDPNKSYLIDPKETWLRLACCDCGLVHDIVFEIIGDKLRFTLETNEDATAEARKELKSREGNNINP